MKGDRLVNSMEYISEEIIMEAKMTGTKKNNHMLKKIAVFFTALLLFSGAGVPALAGDAVYDICYNISPQLAQKLKPVNEISVDNGIEMRVVSAYTYGDTVIMEISLRDLEGDRIDSTTDLFDSYRIRSPYDSVNFCSFKSYDEQSGIAIFLVSVTHMDDVPVEGEKITFSLSKILSQKNRYEGYFDLDLDSVPTEPGIQSIRSFRGFSEKNTEEIYEIARYTKYLLPEKKPLAEPVDGVLITSTGFIDNKLHIQIYYEDILNTDNHGHINLIDGNGNEAENYSISFWDEEKIGSFEEIIYEVTPQTVAGYKAYASFVTTNGAVEGDWEVTFPVETVK